MDTVFSCCWVHMPVYDSVSASFIGKILHVPNEDGNEDDPYAVGSKLWNDTPVNFSSLV